MNWLDLIRVISAGVGLIYTSIILLRSIGDIENVKNDTLAHQTAITSVIVFFGGTITQITFLITGILALLYRPPIDASDAIFIASSIISGILARVIYVRRREILVQLYQDKQELNEYRKIDKKDLKEYRKVDKQDLEDYRRTDDKHS